MVRANRAIAVIVVMFGFALVANETGQKDITNVLLAAGVLMGALIIFMTKGRGDVQL